MVDWPLTFRCNNNCVSCICNLEMIEKTDPPDPSISQIKKVINSVPRGDILGLTGGEPTIRKEFFRFLEYAKERDPEMDIFVVSNGRMFCYREFAERLAKIKLRRLKLGIAIYGHNAETHDAITRTPGSFGQTVSGVKNLIELGIPVELRVIISKLNYRHLEEMAEYVAGTLSGVYRLVFINMKFTGNAFKNRKSLFVRYREIVPHAQRAADIITGRTGIDVKLFHFPLCTIESKYWEYAKGVTKQKSELMFVDECEKCKVREDCPMIWKGYWALAGDGEFKAIKDA